MSKKIKPPFPKQHITPPGIEQNMDPKPRYHAKDYKASGKLKDKVAIITGGDSGIGRAVATLFAREGADITLIYLPEEEVDAAVCKKEIEKAGREALLIPGDITDAAFCENAVKDTIAHYKKIDILVNNAAYQKHRKNIEKVDLEQWDKTFKTNIYGYFYMSKFVLPHMKAGSAIINTGSITGLEGSEHLLDYSATKGAIHAFTKSLAQNLAKKHIRVNCVAPGPVWTPLNPAERTHDDVKCFGASTPYGRPAQPEEIAPSYVFLASNADSSYITGHILTLLGGETTAG